MSNVSFSRVYNSMPYQEYRKSIKRILSKEKWASMKIFLLANVQIPGRTGGAILRPLC